MFSRKECVDLDSVVQQQASFEPRVLDSAVFLKKTGFAGGYNGDHAILTKCQVMLHWLMI